MWWNRRRSSTKKPGKCINYRPNLVQLEDRVVPASNTWDGLGLNNNWSNPLNWSDNSIPMPADTVIFDGTSNKAAVVDAGFGGEIQGVQVTAGYGGSITLNRDLKVDISMDLEASSIIGGSNLIMGQNSVFFWNGGTMGGGGATIINNGSTLYISGAGAKVLDTRGLNNLVGEVLINSSFSVANGASIANWGGTIDFASDASITAGPGLLGQISNMGTLQKSGVTGTSVIPLTVTNSNAINGQSGTLQFTGLLTQNAGTITVSAAILAANVSFNGGSIQGGGTFTANGGVFTWLNGNITGTGTFVNSEVMNIQGPLTVNGFIFSNAGTVNWLASEMTLGAGTVINNNPAANFLIQCSQVIKVGAGAPQINNRGNFKKTAGNGSTTIQPAFNNQAPGLVEAVVGNMVFQGLGTHSSSFQADQGTTIEFQATLQTMGAGSSLAGAGLFRVTEGGNLRAPMGVSLSIPNLEINQGFFLKGILSGPGAISVTTSFVWGGALMQDLRSFTTFGTATIQGNAVHVLDASTFANYGTTTWIGMGDISMINSSLIYNFAVFDMQNDQAITKNATIVGTAFFNLDDGTNRGLLKKSAGNGTSTIAAEFSNQADISLLGRNIAFTGGLGQINNGTTKLAGGTLTAGGNGFFISGGVVSGPGTIVGNVTSSGQIDLGSIVGILTITGNFQQNAGGVLSLKIGGLNPGTQYDQLKVTGTTSLNGTLTVTLVNGFGPAAGNSFNLIHSTGQLSGSFSTYNLPQLGGGLSWVSRYLYANGDFFLDVQ